VSTNIIPIVVCIETIIEEKEIVIEEKQKNWFSCNVNCQEKKSTRLKW